MLNSIPKVLNKQGNLEWVSEILEPISELSRIQATRKLGPLNAFLDLELS